jgi:hypothetical protein
MVMAAYRNGNGQWMCCQNESGTPCPNPAVVQWPRCADGNTDGSDTVPVMACATDQLTADLMAMTHQSQCSAPTGLGQTCDCTPFIPTP